ncbi:MULTISPECIES: hypothetical protein [Mycobacteroides]|uniref:hypothetical protein n=1 Tax=Mycobacteroides TaxID=670516 RepID=UPI0008A9E07C|nr:MULTISPECIES: hypothetical protein [Mycobacteroides]AYM40340.1 hypothetical protein DYE20_01155 [[Mycobacterium] chelonae subsp. gwanakae]OHU15925.1 hypothetical protein BKG75_12820 [Mycobacteroides chelonae]SIF25604.1 Uncharacterised protein [Mycobacteroides abscessus subsp. abscessus]SIF38815.1 Uncharacterised protein [Mycobacteroides abscessus subsp. abscessus]SIF83555.1 Uncharacterised protein [Mycobacteroides abscessus subsp. abscessus]
MTAATARRVQALRARAAHPSTPEAEAQACRELLAKMLPAEPECGCRFCEIVATDPWAAARWQAIRDHPSVRVLVCGAWTTATT